MEQQGFDDINSLLASDAEFDDAGESTQYVTFTIGHEEYGVEIMSVREIMGWIEPTSVPNQKTHMRGVINMRGVIVPVYDLRARFGAGVTEASPLHVYIIVTVENRSLGLLVDAVSDILTVMDQQLQPVPDIDRSIDAEFLTHLVTVNHRMVTLLSLDKLFPGEQRMPDPIAP